MGREVQYTVNETITTTTTYKVKENMEGHEVHDSLALMTDQDCTVYIDNQKRTCFGGLGLTFENKQVNILTIQPTVSTLVDLAVYLEV